MIHILYLAAGNSRRFGGNKLLALLNGQPVFTYGLQRLKELTESRSDCTLTVVSQYDEVLREAEKLQITAVPSPESRQGLSYTIRAGIRAIGAILPQDFLMFVLADQPWLTRATLEKMLKAAEPGCFAATAAHRGRPGSPTLFSSTLVPRLLALKGDEGGRKVLALHPQKVVLVEVACERELWDVDTPADLEKRQ